MSSKNDSYLTFGGSFVAESKKQHELQDRTKNELLNQLIIAEKYIIGTEVDEIAKMYATSEEEIVFSIRMAISKVSLRTNIQPKQEHFATLRKQPAFWGNKITSYKAELQLDYDESIEKHFLDYFTGLNKANKKRIIDLVKTLV